MKRLGARLNKTTRNLSVMSVCSNGMQFCHNFIISSTGLHSKVKKHCKQHLSPCVACIAADK